MNWTKPASCIPLSCILLLALIPWHSFAQTHGSENPEYPSSAPWSKTSPTSRYRFPCSLPSPPITRWIFSFNPWGILEPQAAIGAGIGYRLNRDFEIWSETSFLTRGPLSGYDHISGIRQIFQLKYFFDKNRHFFVAAEGRYKSFSMDDQDYFYNPTIHDTLKNFQHRSLYYFFGAGLQLGGRFRLGKTNNWFLEITAGLGVKNKNWIRYNAPSGYTYWALRSIDFNIGETMKTTGPTIYLPGSIRVVYSFGKKLP